MPSRAHGVGTLNVVRARERFEFMSNRPKKKVLFRMIGPPKLTVPWLILVQLGLVATGTVPAGAPTGSVWFRLLSHVFGSSAVLRKLQTADPENLFVPDRVEYWMVPLPRPTSTSTGVRMSRISPTRSGL